MRIGPRLIVLLLLTVSPMLILSATSWSANGNLFYLGMLPAAVGLFVNVRVAAAGGVITGVLMMLAVQLRDDPVPGALFMAAIGAVVGVSSLRGWHGVGAYAGPQTSFALIGAPTVALSSGTVAAESSSSATLTMGALVAAGGLWIAVMGWLARDALPRSPSTVVPAGAARYFAVALASLVGIATFIAMRWTNASNAWWLVLTLFVVVQPFYAATLERTTYRVIGTVLGATFAAIVVEVLADAPLAITVVTLLVTAGAAWAYLKQPYWVYASLLTPAVILQTPAPSELVLIAGLERVLFTVGAAAMTVAVLAIGHRVITRHRAGSREAPTPSS